jgi:hypothetical protein
MFVANLRRCVPPLQGARDSARVKKLCSNAFCRVVLRTLRTILFCIHLLDQDFGIFSRRHSLSNFPCFANDRSRRCPLIRVQCSLQNEREIQVLAHRPETQQTVNKYDRISENHAKHNKIFITHVHLPWPSSPIRLPWL